MGAGAGSAEGSGSGESSGGSESSVNGESSGSGESSESAQARIRTRRADCSAPLVACYYKMKPEWQHGVGT